MRERGGERKYQLEVLPKVGRPLLIIGVFILAKYPTLYRGEGVHPPSKSRGGTKGEEGGGVATDLPSGPRAGG